jgi:hypothetical protein
MTDHDLAALIEVQEEGAVLGMAEVFPQDTHPFPRVVILDAGGKRSATRRSTPSSQSTTTDTWSGSPPPADLSSCTSALLSTHGAQVRHRPFSTWSSAGCGLAGRTRSCTCSPGTGALDASTTSTDGGRPAQAGSASSHPTRCCWSTASRARDRRAVPCDGWRRGLDEGMRVSSRVGSAITTGVLPKRVQ